MNFKPNSIVEKEILHEVVDYKNSMYNTIKFAFDKRLDCGIRVANCINRLIILIRCF